MKKTLLAVLSLAAVSLAGVNGQVLSWDMQGVAGNSTTVPANTIASNLETTAGLNTLSRTGLTAATAGNSFNSTNWNNTSTFNEADKYISFSLTPSSGYQITTSSLTYAVNGSNTAPNTGRWGYKIGSGSFVLQDPTPFTFALASQTWAFTEFTTTETVEFRFWVYGTTAINNVNPAATAGAGRVGNIAGNDLVLNGSVTAVPEPSTIAFLGFASLGLCFMIWRRRRA